MTTANDADSRLYGAQSPLIVEEDEDLTSFLQRESTLNTPLIDERRHEYFQTTTFTSRASDRSPDGSSHPTSTRLTGSIVLLTLTACISGLLFGYDTGVISSTLVSLGTSLTPTTRLPISTLDKSLITSSTSLFALLVSPGAGQLADRLGRRSVILYADVLFVLGALVQAAAHDVTTMVVGRSIVGLAVGAASLVTPLYISELVPAAWRGRLVVLNVLAITGGQVVAYVLGYWLAGWVGTGWRWMVGLGAVPAAIQLGLLLGMPETPRWLVKVGRAEAAKSVLLRVYGRESEGSVDRLVRTIEREVLEEEAVSAGRQSPSQGKGIWYFLSHRPDGWTELFAIGGNRRALVISCLLQGLQQLCGFNSLMYYSATIFAFAGLPSPILASLSVALTNFTFTVVALLLIDRVGRRRILLLTIPFMAVGLLAAALGFWFFMGYLHGHELDAPAAQGMVWPIATTYWAMFTVASVIVYVAAYATGLGNVPWQQSELFPLNVRSLGCGIATATCWGSNFVVGLTFLPLMQLITPSWTFVLYAVVCAVGWQLVYMIYPETSGMGLEEVGGLLKDGWGVKESLKRRDAMQ